MAIHSQQQLKLTPTARLARRLTQQEAVAAQEAGAKAWLPPQIHSFPAWLATLRQEYFLVADDQRTPIDAQQALHLWRQPIDTQVFLGSSRVAELAQQSWRLIHEHNLEHPERWQSLLLSEDNRSFQTWAKAYQQACRDQGLIDEWQFAAELPKHVASGLLRIPERIQLHGFELALTPLQQQLLNAFEAAGATLERDGPQPSPSAPPQVQQFSSASQELRSAARWARQQLEAEPEASVAIVIPDLSSRLEQVDRCLRQALDPDSFAMRANGLEPWHISLGKPLSQWPLVQTALAILQQQSSRFSQPQIHRLLRSPFLPGWPDELKAREERLVYLAQRAPYDLTAQELLRALHPNDTDLEDESRLAQHIRAWRLARRDFQQSASASQWAANFQQELSSIGFGQGRPLNSREYQTLQRWHSLLEDFSRLDLVVAAPMSRQEAIDAIEERATKTVFRERNAGVPIEVLGVAEALGSTFDAIWITTLDSNTWPGNLQRDPLIPGPVQAAVPRATNEGCLGAAQAELRGLLACAPRVQASFAQGTEEVANQVAGLLGPLEVIEQADDPAPSPAPMETLADDIQAPTLSQPKVRGGTGVLKDQSDCPFRALAKRRLGAVDTTAPKPGLSPGQRGTLVHLALELFWRAVQSATNLQALSPEALEQQINQTASDALQAFTKEYLLTLSRSSQELEHGRIRRVLQRWLEIELTRGDFRVQARELGLELQIGELQLQGTIDRVDQLSDGSTLLIDYKSGNPSTSHWAPEPRIRDPQLPAYALAMDPQPGAISFAQLKTDELRFKGVTQGDAETKGITNLAKTGQGLKAWNDWSELLDAWQQHLSALAHGFQAGAAAVDPKGTWACRHCHLKALCRIHERAPTLADDLAEQAGGDDDE